MIPKGSFIEVNDDFKFHYYDEGDGDVVVFYFMEVGQAHQDIQILKIIFLLLEMQVLE